MPRHCFRFFFFFLVLAPLWRIKSPLQSLYGNYGRGTRIRFKFHMLASQLSISTIHLRPVGCPFRGDGVFTIHVSHPTNKTQAQIHLVLRACLLQTLAQQNAGIGQAFLLCLSSHGAQILAAALPRAMLEKNGLPLKITRQGYPAHHARLGKQALGICLQTTPPARTSFLKLQTPQPHARRQSSDLSIYYPPRLSSLKRLHVSRVQIGPWEPTIP
ncbi:hypothetical protein M441DRAFT_88521 [Trichoderma asperellum CBS 433.97]|uniref:Uncharacterized protein n=1 Tax=Trichoderma asperellum (strain ATCC 204424 / CBS 433.97 / NBRC 101777) TaxID=1042311 RepID=A0A2T3ZB36_TRIA4|nr:hypothetical protein M441DRAFT_88521 [Trichoderma asperellum CBS 433.97]PTB42015.1 hypothetical protein M441DRAFT_88521 [Trichoderma asperellum CBS 433.97]